MPLGTPDYGFVRPYRIRVDSFQSPRDIELEPAALYLLSHTHTDHLTGLSARSFGSRVICSLDARAMLLSMEPAADRIAFDKKELAKRNRPYAHLKVDPLTRADGTKDYSMARDLLVRHCSRFCGEAALTGVLPCPQQAMSLNMPRVFELSNSERVAITLLDANHCLGAVMSVHLLQLRGRLT